MADADVVVFVSNISGNKEIKSKQDSVRNILNCRKIEYREVDISDQANEEQKKLMREKAKPKEGQVNPLPPQIFFKDEYLGDYEALEQANEESYVFEFLRLSPPKTTSEASVTLSEPVKETPVVEQAAESHDPTVLKTKITITLAQQNTENGDE